MSRSRPVTPAEVARRVAALGVIINPATVWAFLRHRHDSAHPERAGAGGSELYLTDDELEEWLDEFLDVVEAERTKLSRAMQAGDARADENGQPP